MSARKLIGVEGEVLRLYDARVPVMDIAERFNCSNVTIYNCLERLGVRRRPIDLAKRVADVNDNCFAQIDSEWSAYVLGLLFADGCLSSGENRLSFVSKDFYLVDVVLAGIVPKQRPRKCVRGYFHGVVFSAIIKSDLIRLGCVPNKTHGLEFPRCDQVPLEFVHHFARGYFDGDGCVFTRSEKEYINVHIVGTEKFLMGLRDAAGFRAGVHKRTGKNVFYYGISSHAETMRFRDWLYRDATIYLNRKREVFDARASSAVLHSNAATVQRYHSVEP